MEIIYYILLVFFIIDIALLIVVILMQNKGEAMGLFASAATQTAFGGDAGDILTKTTTYLTGAFFVLGFTLMVMKSKMDTTIGDFESLYEEFTHNPLDQVYTFTGETIDTSELEGDTAIDEGTTDVQIDTDAQTTSDASQDEIQSIISSIQDENADLDEITEQVQSSDLISDETKQELQLIIDQANEGSLTNDAASQLMLNMLLESFSDKLNEWGIDLNISGSTNN